MVSMNLETSLERLFNSIENSPLYKEYRQIEDILSKDEEIKEIINKVKELEKKATYLENIGDPSYKEIDHQIKDLETVLNNKQVYLEYLDKMDKFNNELSISSKMINDYIKEKV